MIDQEVGRVNWLDVPVTVLGVRVRRGGEVRFRGGQLCEELDPRGLYFVNIAVQTGRWKLGHEISARQLWKRTVKEN